MWGVLLAKNFRGESLDRRSVLPCVKRQSSFAAGLFQKGCAVPVVLGWHLGQKQAASSRQADKQTMVSDFDSIGRNGLRRRENTEFDFQVMRFRQRHCPEARVFESGGPCGVRDCMIDGTHGQNIAYATAQVSAEIK